MSSVLATANVAFLRQLVRGDPKYLQTLGHLVERQTSILRRGHAQFFAAQDDSHPLHLKKGNQDNNHRYEVLSITDQGHWRFKTTTEG